MKNLSIEEIQEGDLVITDNSVKVVEKVNRKDKIVLLSFLTDYEREFLHWTRVENVKLVNKVSKLDH